MSWVDDELRGLLRAWKRTFPEGKEAFEAGAADLIRRANTECPACGRPSYRCQGAGEAECRAG